MIPSITPTIRFADVVHEGLVFREDLPSHRLLLTLIDQPWVQRLRDIYQTANTRLVYMFSEHSRFGHSLGVAYLAEVLLEKLSEQFPEEIVRYRTAVSAAALLHDIGHLAPGSHTAFKAWFPGVPDTHEEVAISILQQDPRMNEALVAIDPSLPETIGAILREDPSLPPWTWQIISGGGWNVDRGNWCMVDSILAGVSYGRYNISALTEAITLTKDGALALRENRLDAMMHFSVSRHAMYRQVYHHRVLLSADTLNRAIVQRARDLGSTLSFGDQWMKEALAATTPEDLTHEAIYAMRESWWRYHLFHWSTGPDAVLRDLSSRLMNRRLFKTVRIRDEAEHGRLWTQASEILEELQLPVRYYLHSVSTTDTHRGETEQPMLVQLDNGSIATLSQLDPLFDALGKSEIRSWLAMPAEVKERLGKRR